MLVVGSLALRWRILCRKLCRQSLFVLLTALNKRLGLNGYYRVTIPKMDRNANIELYEPGKASTSVRLTQEPQSDYSAPIPLNRKLDVSFRHVIWSRMH